MTFTSTQAFPKGRDMTPTDYRAGEQTEATMEKVSETARDAGRRAVNLTEDIADAIRQRPYTALAVAGGLAFAVGALWRLGQQRPHTRLDSLLSHLPELPDRDSLIPRRWR
jgi:ElaB/YqjD/DUF883 family membrane-anchored ribosome-binding protein